MHFKIVSNFFVVFSSFFSSWGAKLHLSLPPPSLNIPVSYKHLNFKARFWCERRRKKKEERRKKKEERRKKKEKRSKKQEARSKKQEARSKKQEARSKKQEARSKKQEERRKIAPTEKSPLPQSHAQDLFVNRVSGNPSLRRARLQTCRRVDVEVEAEA